MLQIFSKDNGNTTYPPYPTGKPTTSNPGDLGNKIEYIYTVLSISNVSG